MENNLNDGSYNGNSTLTLDKEVILSLEEIRRWANFLSIVGFIGIGLMLLVGFFIGSMLNSFGGSAFSSIPAQLVSVVYIVIALIYFFPVYYLYQFATKMKTALYEMHQESLTESFKNMKSLFRFLGIFTILIISLYLIALISMFLFSMFRS